MFNVYNAAQQFTQILNAPVDIKFICLPQTQEWHEDEPDNNVGPVVYNLKGTVQTISPSIDVMVNTVNSPRLFKIYVSHNQDILSLIQSPAREIIVEFMSPMGAIQARVDSFNDYRYNGWVCFTVSQCVPQYYPHMPYNGGFGHGSGGYSGGGYPGGGIMGYD